MRGTPEFLLRVISKGYHFSAFFYEGPSELKWVGRDDVPTSKTLIYSKILFVKEVENNSLRKTFNRNSFYFVWKDGAAICFLLWTNFEIQTFLRLVVDDSIRRNLTSIRN